MLISKSNPYNEINHKKKEIMDGIEAGMWAGSMSYTVWYNNGRQMPREIINWLVELGYQVYHGTPYNQHGGDPKFDQYTYSIYWMYPDDAHRPFKPGEEFQHDYKHAVQEPQKS